jgi:hypothetical protein
MRARFSQLFRAMPRWVREFKSIGLATVFVLIVRTVSLDSRTPSDAGGVGFVPEENLIGRTALILYSRDPSVSWWHVPRWPDAFRRSRFFAAVE